MWRFELADDTSLERVGYDPNKQQFWDAVRIRYNWCLERLPTECVCGEKFDLSHALSCKKGGTRTFSQNRNNEHIHVHLLISFIILIAIILLSTNIIKMNN